MIDYITKHVLPCYNLISDLKDYNIRKKAIKSIHEQLETSIASVETAKVDALRRLEVQHSDRLRELQACFSEQREAMFDEFKESMNTYLLQVPRVRSRVRAVSY